MMKKLCISLGAMLVAGILSGCASSTLLGKSNHGDPRELIAHVLSGQVPPNDYLDLYGDGSVKETPLCALIFYVASPPQINSSAAVDYLLNHGADVNKPCKVRTGNDEYTRAMAPLDGWPLDQVYNLALTRSGSSAKSRPEQMPAIYAFADKLIQRGAKPFPGSRMRFKPGTYENDPSPFTVAKFRQHVDIVEAGAAQFDREREEEKQAEARRNKAKGSLFSAETLAGVATIAGMSANNYAAAKSLSNAQAAALPLAKVATIPPANTAAKSNSTASSATPAIAKPTPSAATTTSAAPVIGAENVKAGAPTLYANSSNLGSAGANISDNQAAQLGARTAGVDLADLDRKPAPTQAPASFSPSSSSNTMQNQQGKEKEKIQWGPVKGEAVVVCRQGKSQKWSCNGPLDDEIIYDSASVEESLKRQRCPNFERVSVTAMVQGVPWETYRCGRALGPGDNDVAKKYNLAAIQRRFICPKNHPMFEPCTTFYDGQDKR